MKEAAQRKKLELVRRVRNSVTWTCICKWRREGTPMQDLRNAWARAENYSLCSAACNQCILTCLIQGSKIGTAGLAGDARMQQLESWR